MERTTMALFSQDKGSEQATVLNDSDCHHRRKRHIGQRVGVQQATEDARCSAEAGVAVDSQTVQKHSNAGTPQHHKSEFGRQSVSPSLELLSIPRMQSKDVVSA